MEKLSIIKIGGNVIDDALSFAKFIGIFASIKGKKILVHGGGKMAGALAQKLGIEQEVINGRRVTNAETLKVVTMVYAGLINKQAVAMLQAKGVNAMGLSGADMNSIQTFKRKNTGTDFGFAGDINDESINVKSISSLLEQNITPVFCSITHDGAGQLLNTNADTIASALACSLAKNYTVQLNYCFEKKGVLKNVTDENSVISSINIPEYKDLLNHGAISEGMIPKLDNAFEAIGKGVNSVMISHWENIGTGTELTA